MYARPEVVDRYYAWSPGKAQRLARRGLLPHHRLPDGSIRFILSEVAAVVVTVPATDIPSESEVSRV